MNIKSKLVSQLVADQTNVKSTTNTDHHLSPDIGDTMLTSLILSDSQIKEDGDLLLVINYSI